MALFDEAQDGFGLENRIDGFGLENRMTVRKRKEIPTDCSEDDPDLLQENTNPLVCFQLLTTNKKVKAGRPSRRREKAPFEEMGRRSKILQAKAAKKGS